MNVILTCRGCGATKPAPDGTPTDHHPSDHCGQCLPWRCETCGDMCSAAAPCSCWLQIEDLTLADVKAAFATIDLSVATAACTSLRGRPSRRPTMPDPTAWPAVAEGIAVRAIREALPDLPPSTPTVLARRIMADLTAAGLLSDPRAIVAATLRTAAEWGEFCAPETLREVADQAEDHHLSDGVCPVCQEVCCDETCPLASYRRSVCAQPATEETP